MTDVYRITASGNGNTSADRVQDFALLKAAETTLAAGGNYFVVVNEADRTKIVSGQAPSVMQTTIAGNIAVSTYTPGGTYTLVKPGEAVMMYLSGEHRSPGFVAASADEAAKLELDAPIAPGMAPREIFFASVRRRTTTNSC